MTYTIIPTLINTDEVTITENTSNQISLKETLYFNVEDSTYTDSFTTSVKETQPSDLCFNNDGTAFFVTGTSSAMVHKYTCSAYDVSTGVFSQTWDSSSIDSAPTGVRFSSDGTKIFLCGQTNSKIFERTLSVAFDLTSTISGTNEFAIDSGIETNIQGVDFNTTGTKMYVTGTGNDGVHEFALGTAWDVTTAVFTRTLSVSSYDIVPRGISFTNSGLNLLVAGDNDNMVDMFTLTTGYDLSTASYANSVSVSSQTSTISGVVGVSSQDKMFITGVSEQKVFEYNTPLIARIQSVAKEGTYYKSV